METKYVTMLWVTYSNGTADKKAIYSYDTMNECLKGLYQYMASYTNGDGVATCLCIAMNHLGGVVKKECWKAAE